MHGLALRHGVKLIMTGHVHGYERFVVDGVHYDRRRRRRAHLRPRGGREEVEAARPGESELRVVAERSYGCTELVIDGGTVSVTRLNVDGETTDSFTVSAS